MCLPAKHMESASRERVSVDEPSLRSSQSMHPVVKPRLVATLFSKLRAVAPDLRAIVVEPPSLKKIVSHLEKIL